MIRGLLATVIAVFALSACSTSAPLTENAVYGQALPPPDATRSYADLTDYRVGPMDVLDVAVYQAPDLTKPVQVDASGHIVMPLIGAVPAAGRTTAEIQADVTSRLKARYLRSPEVTVTVKEFASQKVTVEGSVTQPGVYPIAGRTTLLQALAMARGVDKVANHKRIAVFRNVNNQRMVAVFDLDQIRAGRMEDPQLFANDIVVVDRSGTKGLLQDIVGAVPLMAIFRPF